MEKSIFSRCYTFRSSDKVLNAYQHFKRGEEMGRFEYYPKSKAECIGCPDRDKCDAQTSHLILVDCKSFYYTYNLLEPYNRMPELVGGSADLGPSNMSIMKSRGYYSALTPAETNLHFGVRELAMASISNGIAIHGGLRPYCATFFVFSDYFKGSVRMSALMDLPVLYILSHDSIGVGEDGPTHQPVEQLAMLRTLPNMRVFRPCDGLETAAAYAYWSANKHPVAVVTSRQKLTSPEGTNAEGALKGGYVLSDSDKPVPDVILMGSGSEVYLLIEAKKILAEKGIDARVVSMPCLDEFDVQKASYKESVLPDAVRARVAVEAGSSVCWYKYVGLDGVTVCEDDFGLSAPAGVLFEINRFTPQDVASAAMATIKKAGKR